MPAAEAQERGALLDALFEGLLASHSSARITRRAFEAGRECVFWVTAPPAKAGSSFISVPLCAGCRRIKWLNNSRR